MKHTYLPRKLAVALLALFMSACTNVSIYSIGEGDIVASSGSNCQAGRTEATTMSFAEFFLRTIASAVYGNGTSCSDFYGKNTTFTAEPYEGYTFYGWANDCSGDDLVCSPQLDTNYIDPRNAPITAFFYPTDVATKLDELNIADVWVRNCIAEAMIESKTTNLWEITEAVCYFGHPITSQTEVDITDLSLLTHLESLALWGNSLKSLAAITDAENFTPLVHVLDLSPLSNLEHLTSLMLFGLNSTDYTPITALPITEIKFGMTGIADYSFLTGMSELEKLNFELTNQFLSAEQLPILDTLPNLNHLGLIQADVDLALLQPYSQITSLSLTASDLTNTSLLNDMLQLRKLGLSSTLFTGETVTTLDDISNLTDLTELAIRNNQDLDYTLLKDGHFVALEVLDLGRLDLKNDALDDFNWGAMPNLQQLNLSHNSNLTSLEYLPSEGLEALSTLTMSVTKVTDFAPLVGFLSLADLEFGSISEAYVACEREAEVAAVLPNVNVSHFGCDE